MVTVMTMILISMMSGVPWLSVMTILLLVMLTLRIVVTMRLRLSWVSTGPAWIALMTMLWRVMILVKWWLSGITLIRWSGWVRRSRL